MLDHFCLINMNGRIYDPGLGLFLSPDTIVPDPYSFSGYLRYTYLNNNPLNGIDPTGHAGQGCKNTVDPCHPDQPTVEVVIVWGDDWGGPPDFGQYGGRNLGGGITFSCGGSGCGGFGLSGGGLASFGGNESGGGGNGKSELGCDQAIMDIGNQMRSDAHFVGRTSLFIAGGGIVTIALSGPQSGGLSSGPGAALLGTGLVGFIAADLYDLSGQMVQGVAGGDYGPAALSLLSNSAGLATELLGPVQGLADFMIGAAEFAGSAPLPKQCHKH